MGSDGDSESQEFSVLGLIGQGIPRGYEWNVLSTDAVHAESLNLLKRPGQIEYMREQVQDLARNTFPQRPHGIDVKAVEDFYELRDRSGILGGLNIRLFFGIHDATKAIVLLGIIHKQNNGPTPLGDLVRMRRRWRRHKAVLDATVCASSPGDPPLPHTS